MGASKRFKRITGDVNGAKGRDKIPAMLTDKEFVLNVGAAEALGRMLGGAENLDKFNAMFAREDNPEIFRNRTKIPWDDDNLDLNWKGGRAPWYAGGGGRAGRGGGRGGRRGSGIGFYGGTDINPEYWYDVANNTGGLAPGGFRNAPWGQRNFDPGRYGGQLYYNPLQGLSRRPWLESMTGAGGGTPTGLAEGGRVELEPTPRGMPTEAWDWLQARRSLPFAGEQWPPFRKPGYGPPELVGIGSGAIPRPNPTIPPDSLTGVGPAAYGGPAKMPTSWAATPMPAAQPPPTGMPPAAWDWLQMRRRQPLPFHYGRPYGGGRRQMY